MDIRKIKKLIDLVSENNIAEIEVTEDKESVHIVLNRQPNTVGSNVPQNVVNIPQNGANLLKNDKSNELGQEKPKVEYRVDSPMVGTVYLASAPGAKSFVEMGQKIKVGDTLCLIEAMKTFNKIEADRAGVVMAILVENGQPVEYGQALFTIE